MWGPEPGLLTVAGPRLSPHPHSLAIGPRARPLQGECCRLHTPVLAEGADLGGAGGEGSGRKGVCPPSPPWASEEGDRRLKDCAVARALSWGRVPPTS